jgi:hypothetical protein
MITVNRFGKDVVLDERLKTQLDVLTERSNKDFDNIIIVTGMEGTGKSRGIAFPVAQYLSGTFEVVFMWKQFKEAYERLPPKSTIVWDEFIFAGMAADALSTMQKQIIQMMVTGRKKLINVILVVPSVFLLKNYFAVHRALFMIHTNSPDFLSRGDAYFYSYQRKRILYNTYKKTQYTNLKVANFNFKFVDPKVDYYDMAKYEQMKDEAIRSIGSPDDAEQDEDTLIRGKVPVKQVIIGGINSGMSYRELQKYYLPNLNLRTVQNRYSELSRTIKEKKQEDNMINSTKFGIVPTGLTFNTDLDNEYTQRRSDLE